MEHPGSVADTGGFLRKAAEGPAAGPDRLLGPRSRLCSSSTVQKLGKGKAILGSKGRCKWCLICFMVEIGTGWIFISNPKFWPGANHQLKEINGWYLSNGVSFILSLYLKYIILGTVLFWFQTC